MSDTPLSPASERGESVLASPRKQVTRTATRRLADATCNGLTGLPIAPANPERLALFVSAENGETVACAPYPQSVPFPFSSAGTAQTPTVIHAATFPGLVLEAWYVLGSNGTVVRVYETYVIR